MHQELREALREAVGESSFVLAVNIDIRGFSSFFNDSSQAAAYLSSAYTRILDDYFPDVSFFKPTGDGLLLVRILDRETLGAVVQTYIDAAMRLDQDFSTICADDEMINFPTPAHVGIGLARNTATRISAGGKTLDYSGYPLNLASRLMDLARPRGVIFDASMGIAILSDEQREIFQAEAVFVKGLADDTPMTVYRTPHVVIPDGNRRPFGAEQYVEEPATVTFTAFKKLGPTFSHPMRYKPTTTDSVRLHIETPAVDDKGNKIAGVVRAFSVKPVGFEEAPDGDVARFDYAAIIGALDRGSMKGTWSVTTQLSYSVPTGLRRLHADDDREVLDPSPMSGEELAGSSEAQPDNASQPK